jgi:hypothetical protein
MIVTARVTQLNLKSSCNDGVMAMAINTTPMHTIVA